MKYTGNKNVPGVIELLINNLPRSKNYYSLFFGGGGLETSRYTDDATFICAEPNKYCKIYETTTAIIEYSDYEQLLNDRIIGKSDFIFADPPYTFSSRRSGKRYYQHEFTREQHELFLKKITQLESRVMITHPKCPLYNSFLSNWNKIPFTYQTRQGTFEDCLWMNYSSCSIELLNYDVLGNCFVERQAIKRQRRNIVKKFANMDVHIRRKILEEINNTIN